MSFALLSSFQPELAEFSLSLARFSRRASFGAHKQTPNVGESEKTEKKSRKQQQHSDFLVWFGGKFAAQRLLAEREKEEASEIKVFLFLPRHYTAPRLFMLFSGPQ